MAYQEDAYWQENYSSRSYVNPDATYDDYRPAYRFGVNSYSKIPVVHSTTWTVSCQNWDSARGNSKLPWAHAKHAVRDSWHRVSDRVERAIPGDSDRDGK